MKDNSLDLRPDWTSDCKLSLVATNHESYRSDNVRQTDFYFRFASIIWIKQSGRFTFLKLKYYDADYVFMPKHCMWTFADHPIRLIL